jgi:hypothetical protein
LGTAFWFLNALPERAFEERNGPVHSYSFRLGGWDPYLWRHAWVNRIALFLRRWAARRAGTTEEALLGPLPAPDLLLTHDVDAIAKTSAIRLKQGAFHLFNALRAASRGRPGRSLRKLAQAARSVVGRDDYWCFDLITALEESYGFRSSFFVYGGRGGWRRHPRHVLFDPAYDVGHPRLKQQLREMQARGWTIGLHQSFDAWADPEPMRRERHRLEEALGGPVLACRQHWLRFAWDRTWNAQEAAGFRLDNTLGFNDRPAFRNGAALVFHPWSPSARRPMALEVVPTVIMDSQLYDYASLSEAERQQEIGHWLAEIRAVRGVAAVLWHQQVWAPDYGWGPGYRRLLDGMARA